MSFKRTTAVMNSSRPRTSVQAIRKPRQSSRIQQGTIPPPFSNHVSSGMIHPGFALASGSPDLYPEVSQYWPVMSDNFFSGNDSAHIPALSVAPTELTNQPYWDSTTRYDLDSSSASSGASSKSCISPPMSEAEMMHVDIFQSPVDQFAYCSYEMPLTPPADPFDSMELFGNSKTDPMVFHPLPEPATECEYLGVSKLQFSRSLYLRLTQPD